MQGNDMNMASSHVVTKVNKFTEELQMISSGVQITN